MKQTSSSSSDKTIQSRLTRIVIVPSVVLLLLWFAFSGYTGLQAFTVWLVGVEVQDVSIPAVNALAAVQRERLLTVEALSQPTPDNSALAAQRGQTDIAVAAVKSKLAGLSGSAPQDIKDKTTKLLGLLDKLGQERAQVSAGPAAKGAIFTYYNDVLDAGADLFDTQARAVSDAPASQAGLTATEIFRDADRMSRAASLGDSALLSGQFAAADHLQFADLVGSYHSSLTSNVPFAKQDVQGLYQRLTASAAWQHLSEAENDLVEHGSDSVRGTNGRISFGVSAPEWESLTGQVANQLLDIATAEAKDGAAQGVSDGNSSLVGVIALSVFALLVVLGGILLALRNSRRLVDRTLVSRLDSLRTDSLHRAHDLLPAIMSRVEAGEDIDIESALPALQYGTDEIGQVAEAFTVAQNAAVTAAVRENHARKGFGKVFLGIAHRNQVLVHRQLRVIDAIERHEADPDRLDEIFQLDNLVTRARRNSENLIILAGAKPGRRWRKPRLLVDVVRAAAGEIEHYSRVQVTPMPEVSITGAGVGDTIHLLAELLDNAAQFSSPRSQVQVYATTTTHGVLVEIEDRGLGMSQEIRDAANELLASPPTFDTITVRGDDRLGLFVVANLSHRHGIDVKLRKAEDGGTLAVVLLPPSLLAGGPTDGEEPPQPVQRRRHDLVSVATAAPGSIVERLDTHSPNLEPVSRRLGESVGSTQLRGDLESAPTSPEFPDMAEDRNPPLPQRRRQAHLAPQLRRDVAEPASGEPDDAEDVDQVPERVRDNMAAIQRATREARRQGDLS